MGFMFSLFAFGIIIENIFVLPVLWIIKRLFIPGSFMMQNVHRSFFTVWLWLLKIGGLMEFHPPKGTPVDGPSVIVANHPGLFDVVVLIRVIPKMSVLVKRSLSSSVWLKSVFSLSGYISSPDLNDTGSAIHSLRAAKKILQQGYRFMLFPEGTRSPKGGMSHFHLGAFRIAQMANVPVQPVIIRNSPPFMPKEDHWYYPPYPRSVLELEFIEPIPPPEKGQAEKAAFRLEQRFRKELGLPDETNRANPTE